MGLTLRYSTIHSLDWNLNSMLTYCYLKYIQLKSCTEKDNYIETSCFPFVSSPSVCDLLCLPLLILMEFMYSEGLDPQREGSSK